MFQDASDVEDDVVQTKFLDLNEKIIVPSPEINVVQQTSKNSGGPLQAPLPPPHRPTPHIEIDSVVAVGETEAYVPSLVWNHSDFLAALCLHPPVIMRVCSHQQPVGGSIIVLFVAFLFI